MTKPGRKPNQLKRTQILELLKQGLSNAEIQRRLGGCTKVIRDVTLNHANEIPRKRGVIGRPRDPWQAARLLELARSGVPVGKIASEIGLEYSTVSYHITKLGGMPPRVKKRSELRLSIKEREEISRGLADNQSFNAIARKLGRHGSTVSREVNANGGRENYRAWAAERRCQEKTERPKTPKLISNPKLRAEVEKRLKKRHSPRLISLCLMAEFPEDPEMQISHEAIYQSLFIQGRGALRRELTACLRTGRALRKSRSRESKVGRIKDMVMISERPAEVDDRAIPGHWEGDLIEGKGGKTHIGTLVERTTRFVMLMKLDDKTAPTVRIALEGTVKRLPDELFKSLTWDQGREMAEHANFSFNTDIDVYFCDPHSPWQRGSNENTNRLLRDYFPKGADLSVHSQEALDAVARELNERPREGLGLRTPASMLNELIVALTD